MRGATDCAKRLKSLFASLRARLGKVQRIPASDPITQLILGVFSRDMPEARAREALDKLRAMVVDYNELRVIPPIEMAQALGDYPDVRLKCEDVSRALNRIFAIEHSVTLDRLATISRKDALAYIERIDGLDPYTRARIRLLGLQFHAVPLDEAMWALARREGVIDPKCPLDEAQSFLERHVAEEDAAEFVTLLKKHAWNELASPVRKREVERITSVPPDRTTRNMLQLIANAAGHDVGAGLDMDDELAPSEPEPDRSARKSRSGRAQPPPERPAAKAPAKPAKPARTPTTAVPSASRSARRDSRGAAPRKPAPEPAQPPRKAARKAGARAS